MKLNDQDYLINNLLTQLGQSAGFYAREKAHLQLQIVKLNQRVKELEQENKKLKGEEKTSDDLGQKEVNHDG